MARVKNATIRKTRRRKLHIRTAGFRGARGRLLRQGYEARMKADAYAFRGRKEKKRHFRQLWIARINAALGPHALSYSRFVHGLKKADIGLDRKSLAWLAVHDTAAFGAVVQQAKGAL